MLRLLHATLIGHDLALAWEGGAEDFIPLETLRRRCPCALCQGEPDALGRTARPVPPLPPGATELVGIGRVGSYALHLRWADGHDSGIYPFDYLRRIAGRQDEGPAPAP